MYSDIFSSTHWVAECRSLSFVPLFRPGNASLLCVLKGKEDYELCSLLGISCGCQRTKFTYSFISKTVRENRHTLQPVRSFCSCWSVKKYFCYEMKFSNCVSVMSLFRVVLIQISLSYPNNNCDNISLLGN